MQYNFKVNLTENLYKIFLEDESDFEPEYFNSLHKEFDEFRIKYNDDPKEAGGENLLYMLEGANDHYQILLIGINDNEEKILCWYFVGDDYGDYDEEREQALKDFEKILEYKVD